MTPRDWRDVVDAEMSAELEREAAERADEPRYRVTPLGEAWLAGFAAARAELEAGEAAAEQEYDGWDGRWAR